MKKCYIIIIVFTILFHSSQLAQGFDELSKAVSEKDIVRIIELLDAGINVDVHPEDSTLTALIIACSYPDYEDVVSLLISRDADVNFRGKGGKTPLIWAVSNSYESTKLLLENGADVNEIADDGMNAFIQATFGVLSKKITSEVMDLLLEYGANVNAALTGKDAAGWTALLFATINEDKDLVKYLILHGAYVNHTSDEGVTALSLAKQEKFTSLVQLLKKHGALD